MIAGSGCDGRRGHRHVFGEQIRPLRRNRQHRLLDVEGPEYLLDDVVVLDLDGSQP
jgi:hypothetical protein